MRTLIALVVVLFCLSLAGCCGGETGIELVSPVRVNRYPETAAGARVMYGPPQRFEMRLAPAADACAPGGAAQLPPGYQLATPR